MPQYPQGEFLQRLFYREFLLERGLYKEAGLDHLPTKLASLLGCGEEESISRLLDSPTLEALTSQQLKELLTIRDMSLFSRTAASVSLELKDPRISYDHCIRLALCYAVMSRPGHVFSALRAAAIRDDRFARHHYLYGLMLAHQGNPERALWELGMALSYEPYEEGRLRIRQVQAVIRNGTLD